ncbi:ATP-binding protein [Alienimonas californiensis]|uniref:Serine-protein kinase RsbW n=1 Tax=Alienimonas californiensis TaxID=2527989 RepID=A0A517PC32_9PLAN|nr:ATP-binding protein [Alienimonas californiensis]QDT16911.1 Serine-protein kinase RsbW [Alienimonas californiensis]
MAAAAGEKFALTIPSDTEAGMAAQNRILKSLERLGYTERDLFGMRLALEEALVNAIKHGNKRSEDKVVRVMCQLDEESARVVIRDQGEGFDPGDVPDPTAEENLDRPCGRGIMLMRSFMTEVTYADSGREVTLVKDRTIG